MKQNPWWFYSLDFEFNKKWKTSSNAHMDIKQNLVDSIRATKY